MSSIAFAFVFTRVLVGGGLSVVQCGGHKAVTESNRIVTSVLDSKRAQLFEIFKYLPSPISYLFNEWRRRSRSCISLKSVYWLIIMAHQVQKLLQQKHNSAVP